MAKNFIAEAVPPSHRGLFTKKAKAKGEGVQEYASEVIAKKKGTGKGGKLLKEALFARTMARMHKG